MKKAGAENYIGNAPFSETETQTLRNFTEEIQPDYTLSYHTKGEEIYWGFGDSTHTCPRHFILAKHISDTTGYCVKVAKGSVGGYKDWCVLRFSIPAFTIEAGEDTWTHPLGENALKEIIRKNRWVLYNLSGEV